MNYLMHIYFCTPEPETLVGACLGDFFKGNIATLPYSEKVRQGIQLHRTLDGFADSHPAILQSKTLFPKECRRMAGIALDIFYDHFLAVHWEQYSSLELSDYTKRFYTSALQVKKKFPEEAQYFLQLIIDGDWLTSYRDIATIATVLKRMGKYMPFANTLAETNTILHKNYTELSCLFSEFMQDATQKIPGNHGILL